MARRKSDSPQKAAMREMMQGYLKENDISIKSGNDVNSIMRDMEEKIISMYAKGMTTEDIEAHLKELYDLDISDSTISRITDKIMPLVKEWQERPLQAIEAVYPKTEIQQCIIPSTRSGIPRIMYPIKI